MQDTLQKSPIQSCKEVNILARVVARDIRTTTAKNLRLVETESSGLNWEAHSWRIRVGCISKEPTVPETDSWRFPYLGKLLEKEIEKYTREK